MEGRFFVPLLPLLTLPVAAFTRPVGSPPAAARGPRCPWGAPQMLVWYLVAAAQLYG